MDQKGIALVTGGSRGIGRAAASGLARHGSTVVIVGQQPERVAGATHELVTSGLDVVGHASRELPFFELKSNLTHTLGPLLNDLGGHDV